MTRITKNLLAAIGLLALVALVGAAAFAWSGRYPVGADAPHWTTTRAFLETVRQRSIRAQAGEVAVPPGLDDPARVRQGAGNYDAMCTGCHLAPGMDETEMSRGLYPEPPSLSRTDLDPAEAFWTIKHGIKATGMPAWGKSMADDYIWNMVAFLQALPKLDAAQYRALVASSGGHSHGGGESEAHEHAAGAGDAQDDRSDMHRREEEDGGQDDSASASDESEPHSHPPGTPPHEDTPEPPGAASAAPHVDPPGTVPHKHGAVPETADADADSAEPSEHDHLH